jgi:oligopeptide/dipeptide ABC transporter ATP-binding protein
MSLLTMTGVGVDFGPAREPLSAVRDVTLSVDPGEVIGLVGESGSGKSLTSRAIMRMVPPPGRISSGSIHFGDRDVLAMSNKELRSYRAHDVGMVLQDSSSSLNPVFKVGRQLTETLRSNLGLGRSEAKATAIEMLDRVGIPRPEQHFSSFPHELSGGMRQRVMIALATASRPRLLLADEPTTALDVTTQKQILTLLVGMRRDYDMSILLVSHDFGVIASMCDRVAVMYGGEIVETGPVDAIYGAPQHPYTRALLASVPDLDAVDRRERPTPLEGYPPEVGPVRDECVFVERCPAARSACRDGRMPLADVGANHQSACPFEGAGDRAHHLRANEERAV